MPVFTVAEQWVGRTGGASLDSPRRLRRTFEVRVDVMEVYEPQVIGAVVAAHSDTSLGEPHPAWPPAICREITADQTEPLLWEVVCEYAEPKVEQNGAGTESAGTGGGGGTGGGPAETPQTGPGSGGSLPGGKFEYVPPKISFRPVDTYRPTDVNGKLFLNTAGVAIENPPPGSKINGTFAVYRRYPIDKTHDTQWFQRKIGAVNIDVWGKYDPDYLRIVGADYEPKGGWWEGTWAIEFNEDKWIPWRGMSMGRACRKLTAGLLGVPQSGGLVTRKDDLGNPVHELFPLDDLGQEADVTKAPGVKAVVDAVAGTISKGGPAFVEFQLMYRLVFADVMGSANIY